MAAKLFYILISFSCNILEAMKSFQEWDVSMSAITLAQGDTMLCDAKSHCIICQETCWDLALYIIVCAKSNCITFQETLVYYNLQPWNAQ